jgi:thiol-disulfide isomerase/thioredoxin
MASRLSSLDLFRKVPKDLTQATTHGGALTLLVFTVLSAVLFLECWTYVSGETRAKIVLDQNTNAKLQVNFALSFLELPCRFAEIEMWDYLGNAKLDVTGRIEKNVISGERGAEIGRQYQDGGIQHAKSDGSDPVFTSDFVLDATAENFGIKLKERPYTFVLFYVEWCMFCRMVLPLWHNLGGRVHQEGADRRVQIARINCVEQAKLCSESKISGYPTFMMFKDVHPLQDDYHGHRTVDAFMEYTRGIVGNTDAGEAPALKEQWHEGCLLRGQLMVNRVPGNFHVSAKSDGHNFDQKSSTLPSPAAGAQPCLALSLSLTVVVLSPPPISPSTANTSHIVHELTFGPKMASKMLRKVPRDVKENIDPLAGHSFINHFGHMSHEHNIKVVSTHYETGTLLGHDEILGYQMAVSNHQYDADPNVPTAKFSYDLSPTAVVISQTGRRWYEFVTSLCAIIGGMFTTFQLLNGVLSTVSRKTGVSGAPSDILSPTPKRK